MGKRRRRRHGRRAALVGVLSVGLGVGIGVSQALGSGPEGFHTAAATTGAAAQTLTVSGTAEPAEESSASFQVAGTVTTVAVTLGQRVTAGQTLATVDATSLQEAVTVAQTTLASDQAALTENEDDQQADSGGSTDAQTTSAVRSADTVVLTAAVSPNGSAGLQQAQQAVVSAQHTADVAIQIAQADTQAAATACADADSGTTTTTSTTSTTSTTAPPPGGSGNSAACATALQQALAAENQVSADQSSLASAESTLAQLLSSSSTSNSGSTATSQPTGSTGSGATGSGSTSHSAVAANSAQQLASDEAAIDSDQASLVDAQQNLAAATLASPLSGTVASVGIATGQSVTAGSSTDTITIIDPGAYEATSSLTSSQVGSVKVGDQVQATIDGTTGTIDGTVSRVGPVQQSDSAYTYPVVVALDAAPAAVAAGSAAQLSIDLARADDTLVVPTSAVHTLTSGHAYVDILQDGNTVQKTVTVGVVGSTYTQILSGLTTGERVVLADLSQAVPSSSTNSTSTGRFGGGLGGGGLGGGFGGALPGGGRFQLSDG